MAASVQTMTPPHHYSRRQSARDAQSDYSQPHKSSFSRNRFLADFSQCLVDFVVQLLPTQDEIAVKEDVRKLLERLIRTIEPQSRLLSFGSTANGFSLRNSDMDLCCLIDSEERLSASDLVTMVADLLERETKFHVKPLPHARIPIVKLSLDPSPGLPLGIACDIGFENRLALENTRLLMCYAMVDPTRVRTMVLFLKVWCKRRKINSPYQGTLSSYGYVLLVIYFLVHVKNPPVLPNLQQMPPLRPISKEDTHIGRFNVWFFDDIELLKQRWCSSNIESVAELLVEFFRYYARDFPYNTGVASIRAGLLKKDSKGWQSNLSGGKYDDSRERNRFCIEDPFELDFNVSRCVTKDGLYLIRGEFMRASRILASRPERAILALAELCIERKEGEPPTRPTLFTPPRLPPQTPYTVGSRPVRGAAAAAVPGQLEAPAGASPLAQAQVPSNTNANPESDVEPLPRSPSNPTPVHVGPRTPPAHMAPKRSAWTSPPPPEAPPEDVRHFQHTLARGLALATAPGGAREREHTRAALGESSEGTTDEERSAGGDFGAEGEVDTAEEESDEALSVQSYTEGAGPGTVPARRPSLAPGAQVPAAFVEPPSPVHRPAFGVRGRLPTRVGGVTPAFAAAVWQAAESGTRLDHLRRAASGPPRTAGRLSWSAPTPLALNTPLPPSPDPGLVHAAPEPSIQVFYETPGGSFPLPPTLYPARLVAAPFSAKHQQHQRLEASPTSPASFAPYVMERSASSPLHTPRGLVWPEPSGLRVAVPAGAPYAPTLHAHSASTSTIRVSSTSTAGPGAPSPTNADGPAPVTSPTVSSPRRVGEEPPLDAHVSSGSPTPSSASGCTSASRSPSPVHSAAPSPPSTSPSSPKEVVAAGVVATGEEAMKAAPVEGEGADEKRLESVLPRMAGAENTER